MSQTAMLLASAAHHSGFGLHQKLIVGSTVIVVLFLIALGLMARGQIGIVPKGFGAAFEHVFDWIDGMAADMIGHGSRQYVPFLMSLFLFILFSNWSGLLPLPTLTHHSSTHASASHAPGKAHGDAADAAGSHDAEANSASHAAEPQGEPFLFEPPTSSYNTTLALALISFFAFNWFGIKKNVFPKWGAVASEHEGDEHAHHSAGGIMGFFTWLGHFVQPTPMLWKSLDAPMKYFLCPLLLILFVCLNIVEELARILSLSLRLFGNISGEHQVKSSLFNVMRGFLAQSFAGLKSGNIVTGPGWLAVSGLIFGASLFATLLGALAGFVQAMVFTMLSLVYIAHAVADEH